MSIKNWREFKIKSINRDDKLFPKSLKELTDAPEKLFYRGEWKPELFNKTLAIVGSRRMSRYGKTVVENWMPDLVANGYTIISGFMYGIDTVAHLECLDLNGKTIAVFGGGLDVPTPCENDELYSRILNQGGIVMSEYPNNFEPTLWTFPRRNRIVSGLSSGVLVVEAGLKSGSIITARLAKKQNKKLWAIPGMITSPISQGTNYLIKEGLARMATSPEDICQKKSIYLQNNLPGLYSELEKVIIEAIRTNPLNVDEIARMTNLNIVDVSTVITKLNMEGVVDDVAGMMYLTKNG